MAASSSNFSLGSLWIDLRANGSKLPGDVNDAVNKASGSGGHGGSGGSIHSALRGVRRTAEAVSGGAGAAGIGAAIAGTPGAIIGETLDQIGKFAAKANPAAMAQFNRAFDNFQASIGHAFVPLLNVGTKALDLLGKTADGIATKLAPAIESASGIFEGGFHWLGQAAKAAGLSGEGKQAQQSAHISGVSEFLKGVYQQAASTGGTGTAGSAPSWWNSGVDRLAEALTTDVVAIRKVANWFQGIAGGG